MAFYPTTHDGRSGLDAQRTTARNTCVSRLQLHVTSVGKHAISAHKFDGILQAFVEKVMITLWYSIESQIVNHCFAGSDCR